VDAASYFITWRVRRGAPDLEESERDVVFSALRFFDGQRYALHAAVVMNDHVHVVVTPRPERRLGQLLHSWKSFTAHVLRGNRPGGVWQDESYDRAIMGNAELVEKIAYVRANPWRRWPERDGYPWVWPPFASLESRIG
jgi:REP element-mobilizing transposase RayT